MQNKETIVDDEDCKSVSTNANFHSNFYAKSLEDLEIKQDYITATIPRDNTDLTKDATIRHIKTIGGIIGSACGMIFCGALGCLTGGGIGILGGREVIKHMKKDKKLDSTKFKTTKNYHSESASTMSPSHNLSVKKGHKEFRTSLEINAID